MTPDERDRLVRAEERVAMMEDKLDRIEKKLDELLTAAAMGKGAWWLLLRIGAVITAVGGAVAWVLGYLKGA